MGLKYKVAGYLRLSVEDGDKDVSDSIISQRKIIEEKVRELGDSFEIVDFYIDDGYTGLNTNRPNFQKMINDIENKKVNCVITKDLSRLSRNNFEANYYIEIYFLERDIRYISVLDNVDTKLKNSNNDMIQFKTLINDWYSRDISRKVKSGVWARKEKGLYVAAKAPYGYKKDENDKNQLVIDKDESKIVKRIFQMYINGTKMGEIARKLQEDKVYCPSYNGFEKNKHGDYGWSRSTISKMLKNKMYLGHTEYGKCINLSYKSKKVKHVAREDWKIVENTHKPIITEEMYERAQKLMELNQKSKCRKNKWSLNGLVYCKECGQLMLLKVKYRKDNKTISFRRIYCSSSTHKKRYCERKYQGIDLQIVTQIVITDLNKRVKAIVNSENLADLLKKHYKNTEESEYERERKDISQKLDKSNRIISSLYTDYTEGIIEEFDFKNLYNQEVEKRDSLKEQLEEVSRKQKVKKEFTETDYKAIIQKVSNVRKWTKERLADVISSVEIDINDNIYINYKYDLLGIITK